MEKYNQKFETEHYCFYYSENSLAKNDIEKIASGQELCYKKITDTVKVYPTFKIKYYLIETPEEVGKIYDLLHNCNDNEPCNAFTNFPDAVYAVYNDKIKCIGMHEDTHIISYFKKRPVSAFLREGLAMYMDEMWHGVANSKWVSDFFKSGNDIDLENCFENEYFYSLDCNLSYPLAGAFVDFVVSKFGIDVFLDKIYYNDGFMSQVKLIFENLNGDFKEFALMSSDK